MPLELAIWRVDAKLERLESSSLDDEGRLEEMLDKDIKIASPNWLVIGRQVRTETGALIDLLAIDPDGSLVVLELKRDMTPRDVVAQLLDYGSWVKKLHAEDIAPIFRKYMETYHSGKSDQSIDDAFKDRFGIQMPEELNTSHQLVVVASQLDPSTERIVSYLGQQGTPINAVFFRVFKDTDSKHEYLTRAWFIDPSKAEAAPETSAKEDWNGEFYVSFGVYEGDSHWEDAVKYGYVFGARGSWYTNTLYVLQPGDRVWVNVPGQGYVGVGKVLEPVVRIDKFLVANGKGRQIPITEAPLSAPGFKKYARDNELAAYLVRVKWIKTVPLDEAIHEKGFFGNQNTVCKPTAKSWNYTIERLKKHFGVT